MREIGIAVLILGGIVLLIILYLKLKPYVVKHDTTALFSGGLGAGKTLEAVKTTQVCIHLQRLLHYYWPNFKIKIKNKIIKAKRKAREKQYKKLIKSGLTPQEAFKKLKPKPEFIRKKDKPLVYSNMPMRFKKHLFGFKREWAKKLTIKHMLLLKKINEYSVILIDEMPQFVSQFDWDEPLVQKQLNEFITFFRHYIGGNLIITAQSEDEIECHFRRKLNQGIWCFDFHAWPCRLLPLFYTNRMCDYVISDNIQTMSTTYIEENTRIHFGLFPRKAYNSRCYSPRYKNVEKHAEKKTIKEARWTELTTKEVLRFKPYKSPLDEQATKKEITELERQATALEGRNVKDENTGNQTQP